MSQTTRTVAAGRSIARRWLVRYGGRVGGGILSNTGQTSGKYGELEVHGQLFQMQRHFSEAAATSQNLGNGDSSFAEDHDNPYEIELEDESDYDSDGDQDELPWKTLLELPARAGWRTSDPHLPPIVEKAQVNVLNAGGATLKQIRRSYAGIVASHKALALRRERERRRILNGGRYSRRAHQRDEETLPVFYGRMETLAALRNRLKPNFAITKRILEEVKSLLPGWKPKRIIDMGIGVGCASAAALHIFEKDVEWIHGIDSSRCMRECSKAFLEEIMEELAKKAASNPHQHRVNPPRLTLSGSIATETSSSTFDMALMTYTVTELPDVASPLAAAAILWQKLAPNGILILVEPGTPDGFNTLRSVRNMLLDCCPPLANGEENEAQGDQCHIIAPCTHNSKCPMERYQQAFFRQKHPKTQMEFEPNEELDDPDDDDDDDDDENEDYDYEEDHDDADDLTFHFERIDGDEIEKEMLDLQKRKRSDMTDQTQRLRGRFCSFVQTMSSGNHLKKGEKFSYLVAQKRFPGEKHNADVQPSFQNDRIRDLLMDIYEANEAAGGHASEAQRRHIQDLFEKAKGLEARYLDSEEDELGLELVHGDANRASFGRIIRAPLKNRGHVYIDYCSGPGRLMRSRVAKSFDYGVAPGLYTAARKSRWGGLWPDVAPPPSLSEEIED